MSVTSLPPEFYSPVEDFDSVRHLLENLPEEESLSPAYLAAQMSQTQVVLDAINSQLSARVMRSYGAFVHGMAQVQQLESDLALTAILCRSARRGLGRVQGDFLHGGLGLLSRLRRRSLLERLVTKHQALHELSTTLSSLEVVLAKSPSSSSAGTAASRLSDVVRLVKHCHGSMATVQGLASATALTTRMATLEKRASDVVQKAIESACAQFESSYFDAAISAAISLGKIGDTVSGMNACFTESIKNCTKSVLTTHVLQSIAATGATKGSLSQRELELDRAKYKDVSYRHRSLQGGACPPRPPRPPRQPCLPSRKLTLASTRAAGVHHAAGGVLRLVPR